MARCVFCDIVSKKIKADYVKETDTIVVIKDINPKASIHLLIIPKKHMIHLGHAIQEDVKLLGELLLIAKELSEMIPHASEFKLVANNGEKAGQRVFHLHFHFLVGTIKMLDI